MDLALGMADVDPAKWRLYNQPYISHDHIPMLTPINVCLTKPAS
jgi:hypothetical protein